MLAGRGDPLAKPLTDTTGPPAPPPDTRPSEPIGPAPLPTWRQVIPTSFGELMGGAVGIAVSAVVCWLALQRIEAALQAVVAAFMLWLGWAIRGRIEAARNAPRPPEPASG